MSRTSFQFSKRQEAAPPAGSPFIMSVKTDNGGTSANNQFIIPTNSAYVYDYSVNTSDGQSFNNVTGNLTITFAASGTYDIEITGTFPAIFFNNDLDDRKITEVKQWGSPVWKEIQFYDCKSLQITATDIPDLSECTSLNQMLRNCNQISNIPNIESWDVSNVQNFGLMFYGPSFNQDISGWNVSSAVNVDGMFLGCTTFNQDLSGWNMPNVTSFYRLFENCRAFNADISGWNTSNVTRMDRIFLGAFDFNQDISGWDMSNVTTINSMFGSTQQFNQPIGNWNLTTALTDVAGCFTSASGFNQPIGNWPMQNVTNISSFLQNNTGFNQDLSAWDVSSVTNMSYFMFGNNSFRNDSLNNWNLINCKNFYRCFEGCDFNGNVTGWTLGASNTHFGRMFANNNAFNKDISGWNIEGGYIFNDFAIGGFGAFTFLDNIYNAWSQQNVSQNESIDFGSATYTTAGQAGKDSLINNDGWTISDGGLI